MLPSGPRHIVYVVDISGSMVSPEADRLARARAEVRQALETLRPEESFDIVAFYADIKVFRGFQVLATPENIAGGNAFLDSLDVEGGTNFEKALLSALGRRGVNLIVFITDGVPTQGQTNWKKLKRRILNANRIGKTKLLRVRIFTVGLVGRDPRGRDRSQEAVDLLRQIAGENNGQFKFFPLG